MANPSTYELSIRDWAAGTKLVDGDGSPLVLYHGTCAQFDEFRSSKKGLFGCGVYLTDSRDDALEFVCEEGLVLEVYARLTRPFYTTGDYDRGEAFEIDSPTIPLLQELYGVEFMKVCALMDDQGHLGDKLYKDLQQMGHDGIVVQWPACAGHPGVQHVIVFDPSQIHIRTASQVEAPSPMRQRLSA